MRNECKRFGGHVDIEVSYKILWLNVLKETFEAILMKNTPRNLGVKPSIHIYIYIFKSPYQKSHN
jgi:hypothetical protein